jgi:hypothetical protein
LIKHSRLQLFWPIFIGVLAFLIVTGPLPLLVSNTNWLLAPDPSQRQLGWEFFRHSPWTFPLGLNPNYGLEIASSVVFSDSVPIMALVFKFISPLLPERFQYFGLWILLCFILQAIFSWLIAGLLTDRLILKVGVCILLGVFALPMIKRMGLHASIMSHFFILAAIYLNFYNPVRHRLIYWGALLVCSSLVHFYVFFMVGALWVASVLDAVQTKHQDFKSAFIEVISMTAFVGIATWSGGYFLGSTPALGGEGFGVYKLNVLSLFDSNRWSYLLPPIPHPQDLEEGFNYLGLGILFLIPFALYKVINLHTYWMGVCKKHVFYCSLLILLTAFSLTNNISIGNYTTYFELPQFLIRYFEVLRSSGRLFWPVFYTICLCILALIIRGYSQKNAVALIAIACLLQIVDSSAGWLPVRNQITNEIRHPAPAELQHPFWESAAKHYSKVKVFPLKTSQNQIYWHQIGHFAAKHRLGTNTVYLGRAANTISVNRANEEFEQQKSSGVYDVDTMYILDEWKNNPASTPINFKAHEDLLAIIDGFIVFAPQWKTCASCLQVNPELEITSIAPKTHLQQPILFSKSEVGHIFLKQIGSVQRGYGWSFPEAWGIWSDGAYATMALPLPDKRARFLEIQAQFFLSEKHPKSDFIVEVNQSQKTRISIDQKGVSTFKIPLPENLHYPEFLNLQFHFLNPVSPQEIGMPNNDQRKLGIGLISATFLP